MNRRPSLITTAFLLLALCGIGFAAGTAAQSAKSKPGSEDVYKYLDPFAHALALIRDKYVDEDKTDPKKLVYGALEGMVDTLDPFSQFMLPDEYKEMQTETSGEFGGLGIEIAIKDERLTVISPIEGTPADRAGIKAGDWIVKIGTEKTAGMNINEAVKRLRGKKGTKVTITIQRAGLAESFEVTIVRDKIKIESIRSYLLAGHIGYVRVAEFIQHTTEDLQNAVRNMQKEGPLKGLVLDLRNDPGGLLEEAVGVSDFFAENGKMIVFTKGRSPNQTQEFKASGGEKFDKRIPVVAIVNEGSASGAEIVAGCLKDLKRAVLIGSKTFGKGSVQTILPLDNSDGAALRLTMAKYYTPSGVCIHGIGIDPELNLKEPEVSESTLKAYSKQMPRKFAVEKVKQNLAVTAEMEITDALLSEFYDYCMKDLKKIDRVELEKDAKQFKSSILIELIREKLGEKEARKAAVMRDPQVKVAVEIIGNGGKISKQLIARYPKKDDKEEAAEKKLEREHSKQPQNEAPDQTQENK